MGELDLGLYLHIPFCRSKCAYCDFCSFPGLESLFADYVSALIREAARRGPAEVQTIYVGGGTPTLLPLSLLEPMLEAVHRCFRVAPGAEVSIEANPGTVDAPTLAGLRRLGVNRLSLGVQSLDDGELRLLGRIHTAGEALAAFGEARRAGLENINLDLIFGIPGQALPEWRRSMDRALSLEPDHLSLYALAVEEGTPLAARIQAGDLPEPDPDLAAEMYEVAEETLAAAGFLHYEISNWAARAEAQCRHNLIYWHNEPYLGLGAGAHSWFHGRRWANVGSPQEYVRRLQAGDPPIDEMDVIAHDVEIGETLMMGLRLLEEGVGLTRFRARFGEDLCGRFAPAIGELQAAGLLEVLPDRIRLTVRGRLLANQVFVRFLPDE